jgi:hypothetical protein
MRSIDALAQRLVAASQKARPGFDPIDWPESVGPEAEWFMTPELLSPAGLLEFENLSEEQRKRLSFFEAVNFFSLNIHGEKPLVAGLADRLYQPRRAELAPYLHHFLEEENRHMAWFGRFCQHYAGKVYAEKRLPLEAGRSDGAEDLVFFAQALLFEEIVDVYNSTMADDARISRVARDINRLHHEDEHRHIVFGRRTVLMLFEAAEKTLSREQIAVLRAELLSFTEMTWRQYWNPEVYRDAGIADPYGFMRRAWSHPAAVARRQAIGDKAFGWMRQAGILAEKPPEDADTGVRQ